MAVRSLGIDKKTGKEKFQIDTYDKEGERYRPTFIGTKAEAYQRERDIKELSGKIRCQAKLILRQNETHSATTKDNRSQIILKVCRTHESLVF
jgi:hypothetical protein